MSEDELLFLLEQSRARNERQNVTGMLLYGGGNFIQVLEGSEKDVDEIYKAIKGDERNKGNIVIEKSEITERTFPDWSMGFKHLARRDRSNIRGYTEFLERRMEPHEFTNKKDHVVDLLYKIKEYL